MTAETNPRPGADVRSVALYQFDGTDVWQEGDDRARLRGYFPLSPGTPNAGELSGEDLTMVCMEIEPGNYLPTHRDSAEELLLVIEGRVEASVDDATIDLRTGDCTIVPEGAPHGLRNVGEDPARVVGIFPRGELTATFEHPLVPFESATVHVGGEDGSE
jgi:quercetin dioxygenase-like cupin family protein